MYFEHGLYFVFFAFVFVFVVFAVADGCLPVPRRHTGRRAFGVRVQRCGGLLLWHAHPAAVAYVTL
jgi:hypothetical protein